MKKIILIAIAFSVCSIAIAEILKQNGRAGNTGSPGEQTCSNCHGTASGATISLSCSNMLNWEYQAGTTYHMSVTVSKVGLSLFGLGVEALTSSNTNAGNFIITNSAETQVLVSAGRNNVTHKLNGGSATDSKIFNFDWTAPTLANGNITFYFSGIAANSSGTSAGDFAANGNQLMTPLNTTAILNNSQTNNISLWPNPVSNSFFLNMKSIAQETIQVEIIDFSGKTLQSEKIASSPQAAATVTLNDNIYNGIYFVRTVTSNNTTLQKIIVTR